MFGELLYLWPIVTLGLRGDDSRNPEPWDGDGTGSYWVKGRGWGWELQAGAGSWGWGLGVGFVKLSKGKEYSLRA